MRGEHFQSLARRSGGAKARGWNGPACLAAGLAVLLQINVSVARDASGCAELNQQAGAANFSIEADGGLVSLDAKNAELGAVVVEIARRFGLELATDDPLAGTVNIELNRVPLSKALHQLLGSRDFVLYYAPPGGDGRPASGSGMLRILTPGNVVDGAAAADRGAPTRDIAALSTDVQKRKQQARAAAKLPPDAAVEHLSFALADEDPSVRVEAVAALMEVGGEPVSNALAAALNDADPWVRQEAVYALGVAGGEETPRVLRQAITDADKHVRQAAIEALAMRPRPGSARVLAEALSDPEPSLRAQAVEVLGDIEGAVSTEALQKALEDPDAGVRESAGLALGEAAPAEH